MSLGLGGYAPDGSLASGLRANPIISNVNARVTATKLIDLAAALSELRAEERVNEENIMEFNALASGLVDRVLKDESKTQRALAAIDSVIKTESRARTKEIMQLIVAIKDVSAEMSELINDVSSLNDAEQITIAIEKTMNAALVARGGMGLIADIVETIPVIGPSVAGYINMFKDGTTLALNSYDAIRQTGMLDVVTSSLQALRVHKTPVVDDFKSALVDSKSVDEMIEHLIDNDYEGLKIRELHVHRASTATAVMSRVIHTEATQASMVHVYYEIYPPSLFVIIRISYSLAGLAYEVRNWTGEGEFNVINTIVFQSHGAINIPNGVVVDRPFKDMAGVKELYALLLTLTEMDKKRVIKVVEGEIIGILEQYLLEGVLPDEKLFQVDYNENLSLSRSLDWGVLRERSSELVESARKNLTLRSKRNEKYALHITPHIVMPDITDMRYQPHYVRIDSFDRMVTAAGDSTDEVAFRYLFGPFHDSGKYKLSVEFNSYGIITKRVYCNSEAGCGLLSEASDSAQLQFFEFIVSPTGDVMWLTNRLSLTNIPNSLGASFELLFTGSSMSLVNIRLAYGLTKELNSVPINKQRYIENFGKDPHWIRRPSTSVKNDSDRLKPWPLYLRPSDPMVIKHIHDFNARN